MRNIKFILAVMGVMSLMPVAMKAMAHCNAGQECIPDPCNTHHGEKCPPAVQESINALQSMQQQASAGVAQRVFTVIEIETINLPVDPSGTARIVPKIEMPIVSDQAKAPSSPSQLTPFPDGNPRPMTPTEFIKHGLPVSDAQGLNAVKQGVLDSSRELLDVSASDDVANKTPGAASGRMKALHLNFASETFKKLQQYDTVMKITLDKIGQGQMPLSKNQKTEMEKLYRYTQSVIQLEGGIPNE